MFEPQALLSEIAEFTHYLPDSWKKKMHSDKVRREFVAMYEYRLVVFAMELLGVLFVPFILCFTLSGSAQDVVDFFRDFSVEKDESIGPICSFAAFDFKHNGDTLVSSALLFLFFSFLTSVTISLLFQVRRPWREEGRE